MKLRLALPALLPLFALHLLPTACKDDHDHADTGGEDVVFEGEATDEALADLTGQAPKTDAVKKARFTAPAAGAKLAAASPAAFTWTFGATGGGATDAGLGLFVPAPVPARVLVPVPVRGLDLLGAERVARAHGEPVNGTAYYLVMSDAAGERLKVFTTNASYTPDAAAWDTLKHASGTITATVTTAIFDTNKVTSDGGPYAGEPITFTIAP